MMSMSERLSADGAAGARLGNLLRQSLAVACVSLLAGIGVHTAWQERFGMEDVLLALAVTLGPATAYMFGYFRCLPDVLGGSAANKARTPLQRWSEFARVSAVVAILMTWVGWAVVLARSSRSEVSEAVQVVIGLLVFTSFMPACVVASEKYLARTMIRGDEGGGVGWRAAVGRAAGRSGAPLVKLLGAKLSLVSGSTLALASLLLTTTFMVDGCADIPREGYKIVSGNAAWITAVHSVEGDTAKVILAQVGRWCYVAGLAVSLLALAAVLAGGAGDKLRRSRLLGIVSGTLALFGICDFTFALIRVWTDGVRFEGANFAVGILVWLLPVALWLWRARGGGERWAHTRLAVMVFYLPILFFSLAFLLFFVPVGYVSFFLGMLLVWWGFVQSEWETAGLP